MDAPDHGFALAGTLEELKAKRMLVLHGSHRPILVVYDRGRVFALDNRCPHMGFPLERGSVEDGILTCHWHHARFDLESGCTFDLWADDVPVCPVEIRDGTVWVRTTLGHADPAAHWTQRLERGRKGFFDRTSDSRPALLTAPEPPAPPKCSREDHAGEAASCRSTPSCGPVGATPCG